jgi:sigma-E factor negative regulatory protein RseB
MQPGLRLWLMCLALSCLPAVAGPAEQPLSSAEARKWLERIHSAAHATNYQGILVNSADGSLSSARVAHFCDRAQSYERVEMLDGQMRLSYRHNDWVYTLWPQSRVAVIEERDPRQASLRQVIEPRAADQYDVREQGSERVAGRDAQVLLLSPRDEQRFAQRVWIDRQSGLMLRADVLGPSRQVLESSAFSEVEIGVKSRPLSVLQPMKRLEGYRQVRPAQTSTQLEAEGWSLKPSVPGFVLASCAKRSLDPANAGSAATVLQAVFSDGLTHVSVFVEPYDTKRHTGALSTQVGATSTLMHSLGDAWWITVVGDVPVSTLKQFYQSLERKR